MKNISLFILFFLFHHFLLAQDDSLAFHKSINFENEIILNTIDYYGKIYICDKKGVIKRLDNLGNTEVIFSPSSSFVPTNFDTKNPNQIFIFYQELQEWVILNRFLTEIERYKVSEKIESSVYNQIGFVRLLVPSPNNTLWFFDESDFSLKNYDVLNKQILSQTSLGLLLKNEEYPISYLQFYQGHVFLGVQGQGILIFDNFGNYKTILEYPNWVSISFEKEFILINTGQKIIKKGLYNKSIQEFLLPPNNTSIMNNIFQFDSKIYQITKNKVFIYTISIKK